MGIKKILYFVLIVLISASLALATVNKSIHVDPGRTVNKGLSSVNGSIYIGNGCRVAGSCSTVNGRIKVKDGCSLRSLGTVNGGITVGEESIIDGKISTINGYVTCHRGVSVKREIYTVNGRIHLTGTTVEDGLTTCNGNISLLEKSQVQGDILIKKCNRGGFLGIFKPRRKRLTIRVQGGSMVLGDIINKDPYVDARVIIAKGSVVRGEIRNARVIEE
jgi:DUF4097 and DUF4098 domain-containing protein YvlB